MIDDRKQSDPQLSIVHLRPVWPWRRVFITFAAIVPLVWLLAFGFTRDARYISSPLIGRDAPNFTVKLFHGEEIELDQLRGRVVFLNFWASWCLPCRVEARELEDAWQRLKDRDVVFLGINIQDDEQAAATFLREFGVTYPNGRDLSGRIAVEYGVWGVPETFVIDPNGKITYKHVGTPGGEIIPAKVEEARQGLVSAKEGKGSYQPIR
jgi:cytochrome c biogenesis protein CcmG, thiol:disulfide interchange protein DsbE